MNKIQKTLAGIVTALAVVSCSTNNVPEQKNYDNRPGHVRCGTVDGLILSGPDGRAYAISGVDYGFIAVDTSATHKIYSGKGGSAVVMNDEMVELATRIKNDQAKLTYKLDSAHFAQHNN